MGAGIATVTAYLSIVLTLTLLIFSKKNREKFGTWQYRRFDKELFGRLMRYGAPSGIQFFLEVFGFTFFIQMLGRLGATELAVSNIVLSIESLSFMPMNDGTPISGSSVAAYFRGKLLIGSVFDPKFLVCSTLE